MVLTVVMLTPTYPYLTCYVDPWCVTPGYNGSRHEVFRLATIYYNGPGQVTQITPMRYVGPWWIPPGHDTLGHYVASAHSVLRQAMIVRP